MADEPGIAHDTILNDHSLQKCYEHLFRLLERFKIPATFAVVGLFVAGEEETVEYLRSSQDDLVRSKWLGVLRDAISTRRVDGWFFRDLPRMVIDAGVHELASHGYSHLPFTSPGFNGQHANIELGHMRDLGIRNRWSISSMVFPRNQVAYAKELPRYGILRYRDSAVGGSYTQRIQSLLGELNPWTCSDAVPQATDLVAAGRFLNWRHGIRRLVPAAITVRRWRSIMMHAERSGGCAHLWFHPHNLITGHQQWDLLEAVLRETQSMIREGRLQVRTFSQVGGVR
jgi:hypothetical protein